MQSREAEHRHGQRYKQVVLKDHAVHLKTAFMMHTEEMAIKANAAGCKAILKSVLKRF